MDTFETYQAADDAQGRGACRGEGGRRCGREAANGGASGGGVGRSGGWSTAGGGRRSGAGATEEWCVVGGRRTQRIRHGDCRVPRRLTCVWPQQRLSRVYAHGKGGLPCELLSTVCSRQVKKKIGFSFHFIYLYKYSLEYT
jgi:hypothetical protein